MNADASWAVYLRDSPEYVSQSISRCRVGVVLIEFLHQLRLCHRPFCFQNLHDCFS